MHRLLLVFLCLPWPSSGQSRQVTRQLHPVHFQAPVAVYFRLDTPVVNAEHQLIMEAALLPMLDTLSFQGMLNQPGIYFSTIYNSTVPGNPSRKYYRAAPVAQGDGDYPFNHQKVNVKPLERPARGRFYFRKEVAASYGWWFTRKDPTDMGVNSLANTLPGVDSVRVVYVLQKRPRWKRSLKGSAVK